MKYTEIQRKIVRVYSDKQLLFNLSFYFVAAASIWYLYNLKVLGMLTLFFASIFALSNFLTELYFSFNQGFKKFELSLVGLSLFNLITFYLAYKFLSTINLGYTCVFSIVITVIVVSRR